MILVDSDSLNIDSSYVKNFGKDQRDVDKKQSEGYLNELSVKDSKLIVDIDIKKVKEPFSCFNPIRIVIDSFVKDVLKGNTRLELPINGILFSGKFLNGLQKQKELLENKKEPRTVTKLVSNVEQHAPRTGPEESRTL